MLLELKDVTVHYETAEAVKRVSYAWTMGRGWHHRGQWRRQEHHFKGYIRIGAADSWEVHFKGVRIDGLPAHEIVKHGIVQVLKVAGFFLI